MSYRAAPPTSDTLAQLVRIPSVNPAFDPESAGEGAIADWVAGILAGAGFEVEMIEPTPGRISVLATLDGGSPGPTLMLNGHIDTVDVGGHADPFAAHVEEGRLYGRGAYDMKSGVAACIEAARALAGDGRFAGRLQISAVADEEHGSLGTRAVLERTVPDAVIVTEPTGLRACSAHRGFVWIEIETRGRAAHGSMPDKGRDANRMMGRVLERIGRISAELAASEGHPVAGRGSLHVGSLQGGGQWSVYADRCVARLERRTVPGEMGATLLSELQAQLDDLAAEDPSFEATARLILERPPFETSDDSPLLAAIRTSSLPDASTRAQGVAFWTDAALFAAAGSDTTVLGADGDGAHADVEWTDLESVETLTRVLVETARAYLA